MRQFQTVALGGTFDRLHAGHEAFLKFALSKGNTLIIGLTTDLYLLKHKPNAKTLSYEFRKKDLERFLSSSGVLDRVIISPIDANEIPSTYRKTIEALIVTDETIRGAEDLNRNRLALGLSPFPIIPFPRVLADDSSTIASTKIREGMIDRAGKSYLTDDMLSSTFVLPENIREKLKRPIGDFIDESHLSSIKNSATCLITVGDITTKTFLEKGIAQDISIVDFVVERVKRFSSVADIGFSGNEHIYHIENQQSTLGPVVFQTLAHLFYSNRKKNQQSVVVVSGEEDLLVIPVILLAPLGAVVVYGQPRRGMVKVEVSENLKQKMRKLLEQFEKKHA